ncbi:MAG TPA: ATP-binding cassette domain-containing protein, partial [Pseudomonadales bacterium]|nr:ATP-binding cassette domain-containing protein [Pseudomonadales bacterium]
MSRLVKLPDEVAAHLGRTTAELAVADDATEMLELRGLATGFGGNTVLHGVDLAVRRGEVAGVLGLNGAGKSVTMKVVAGIQPAWEGQVLLDGRDITALSAEERVASGMGHVTQGRQV